MPNFKPKRPLTTGAEADTDTFEAFLKMALDNIVITEDAPHNSSKEAQASETTTI
jgi:hypothetical protein